MLTSLYTFGFLTALFSLILWFIFKENKWAGQLFGKTLLLSMFVYLGGLLFASGAINYKMFILCRDLSIMAVLSVTFSLMSKNKLAVLALFLGLGAFIKFFYFGQLQQSFPQNLVEIDEAGELLIDVNEAKDINALYRIFEKYDIKYEPAFGNIASPEDTKLDDYLLLNIPSKYAHKREQIEQELMESGLVDDVEENELISVAPLEGTNEAVNKIDYGINDPGVPNQWAMPKLEMNKLYDLLRSGKIKPKKKALIAILDTGIDAKHEDIAANYKSTDVRYDRDKMGHGTHCAGIANAVTNNAKGIASFTPNNTFTEVTSIKVLADYGGGTQRGIIQGMIKAADKGADVISMSLGGPSNDERQRAYAKAVKYANKKGAIVVVAAGNSNRNAKDYIPAGAKGVIAVSAVDSDIKRAVFSNYVTDVDMGIAAPGVNIYSTVPGNAYKMYNGTSMACPHVAGLLGLMKSINPKLTTKEAYDILNKTGKDTEDTKATGKFIYPAEAVKQTMKSRSLLDKIYQ